MVIIGTTESERVKGLSGNKRLKIVNLKYLSLAGSCLHKMYTTV